MNKLIVAAIRCSLIFLVPSATYAVSAQWDPDPISVGLNTIFPTAPGNLFSILNSGQFDFQFSGDTANYGATPFDLSPVSMDRNGFSFQPVTGSWELPEDNGSAIYKGALTNFSSSRGVGSVPEKSTTLGLAIDPMALIPSGRAYLTWVEMHHPRVPKVRDLKDIVCMMTAEERRAALARAKSLSEFGSVAQEAIEAFNKTLKP
jgi:hypothetical protein